MQRLQHRAGCFEIHADERRPKVLAHHDLYRFQRLLGVSRPALGRLTPAFNTVFGFYAHDQRPAVFESASRATVDVCHGQDQRVDFNGDDSNHATPKGPVSFEMSSSFSTFWTVSINRSSFFSPSMWRGKIFGFCFRFYRRTEVCGVSLA